MKSILQRTRTIGPARIYPVPIQLDPLPYRGAIVQGSDGSMYYSNGVAWERLLTSEEIAPSVIVVPDIAARDELPETPGTQALVEDRGNGQWGLFVYDGTQWLLIGTEGSTDSEAKTLVVEIDFNSPPQISAGVVPNNSRITVITNTVSVAFDGGATLDIGDEDINDRLFPNEFVDLALADTYFVQSNHVYTSAQDPGGVEVFLYFNPGTSTQGEARIVISYV